MSIELNKINCWNFPDTTGNFEKKLSYKHVFIKYVPTLLAILKGICYKEQVFIKYVPL